MALSLRDVLARASTRPSQEPTWDADAAPETPWPLLEEWVTAAIDGGVLAVNAATLATASERGLPSARTVLISEITEDGAWFATSALSPAGRDLSGNPRAELVLYLREHSRQIRISGTVTRGDAAQGADAFRSRGIGSRASTLAGIQSAPRPATADDLIAAARQRLDTDSTVVDPEWRAYLLTPTRIEFWQSRRESGEQRLQYRIASDNWNKKRLWP